MIGLMIYLLKMWTKFLIWKLLRSIHSEIVSFLLTSLEGLWSIWFCLMDLMKVWRFVDHGW